MQEVIADPSTANSVVSSRHAHNLLAAAAACPDVTVVTQGYCQHFLQGSSEPKSMLNVLGKPAVNQCWANADLYDRQTCTGVTVVTQVLSTLFAEQQ